MKRKIVFTALSLMVVLLGIEHARVRPVLAQVRAALVQNVDEPGRNVFAQQQSNFTLNPYFAIFTVPAGQRYVVEQYMASCDVVNATSMTEVEIRTTAGGSSADASAPAHVVQTNGFVNGSAVYLWSATGLGPVYADPGTNINISAAALAGTGGTNIKDCLFTISGHYVTL